MFTNNPSLSAIARSGVEIECRVKRRKEDLDEPDSLFLNFFPSASLFFILLLPIKLHGTEPSCKGLGGVSVAIGPREFRDSKFLARAT